MNSKTHMVVMEVVSQHLDKHKNNGLIFLSCKKFCQDRFEYAALRNF